MLITEIKTKYLILQFTSAIIFTLKADENIDMISKNIKPLVFLLSTCFVSPAIASSTINETVNQAGQLAKYQGEILIRQDQKSKPQLVDESGAVLRVGNQLRTQKDSEAFIRWIDGSKIVMKEKSQLSINAIDYLNVDNGSVIFNIANIQRPKPVRVGVKLAILGIRGTKFIVVNQDENYNVYLKEGNITITSLSEDFKIYKKQIESQMREFHEQFKREAKQFTFELKSDFEAFKKETEMGQAELVNEFKLIESTGIKISDGILTLVPIPKNIDEQFILLDSF